VTREYSDAFRITEIECESRFGCFFFVWYSLSRGEKRLAGGGNVRNASIVCGALFVWHLLMCHAARPWRQVTLRQWPDVIRRRWSLLSWRGWPWRLPLYFSRGIYPSRLIGSSSPLLFFFSFTFPSLFPAIFFSGFFPLLFFFVALFLNLARCIFGTL